MDHFDEKLRMLETNSFDKKMQQYYSKMKKMNVIDPPNNPEMLISLAEDYHFETFALRGMNDSARKKIACLEVELTQLRALREAESNTYSQYIGLVKRPAVDSSIAVSLSDDISLIYENRRRERQATTAVAEHDAILIRRLQDEMTLLQSTYDADVRLLKDKNDKIASLIHVNTEKDRKIAEMEVGYQRASSEIRSLTLQLESVKRLPEIDRHSLHASAVESSQKKGADDNTNSRPSSANTRHEDKSSSSRDDNSSHRTKTAAKVDSCNFSTIKLTTCAWSQNNRLKALVPNTPSQKTSNCFQDRSQTESATLNSLRGNGLKQPEKCFDDIRNIDSCTLSKTDLRSQNARLLVTLERERHLLRGQECALNKIRDSALEITLLEAEEIARLENDLITCRDENDKWQKRCISAEFQADRLSQQLKQLELLLNHGDLTYYNGSNNYMQ